MWLLALKSFLRSKIALVGILFLLVAGISSIHIGKKFVQKQQESIDKTIAFQKEHIKRNVQYHSDELGLLLYYLRFAYVNKPNSLNALSIGQRDVNNSIQSITIRNLENQKYDTDLYNPANLLAGNLDFSFVLIYLFPLVIIAFTYNVLSEEKENQTWKLVRVQAKSPLKVLWHKLVIRTGAIYFALAIILGYAIVVVPLQVDMALAGFVALAVLYVAFWFALCFWVISWQRNSSVNAVSLLSFWVMLTIVSSAIVNNYLITAYPVPEALSTMIEQREGYHEKWDLDKKVTMDKFYAHYPHLAQYKLPDKTFSWLWYYAMQQMGDDDAQEEALAMQNKLSLREDISNKISSFIPSLHTQQHLNNLARAGLLNHLRFLNSTTQFHEKLRLYFYPKIFEEVPVDNENWGQWKVEFFEEDVEKDWAMMVLPLLNVIALAFLLGFINFRRKEASSQ